MQFQRTILVLLSFFFISTLYSQNLTIYRTANSVDTTVMKIVEAIKSKDLVYFETVSHDAIAKERGINMAPTRMILFEDPDLMIKLIHCRQTTALDLPMKILVWEENEDVYIGFFDPKVMKKRFLLQGCEDVITEMSKLKIRLIAEILKD
ncbi:MAG: DUF302 domain-containing protein [Ekhidna sp.]